MNTSAKVALGLIAGAGALYGTRTWLRSRRRIDLEGRVVLITGSSTGLGFLLAKGAAERGAVVVLNARDEAELAAAEAEVRAHGARDVLAVPADVGVEAEASRLVHRAVERFGRLDVLVNNAGTILVGPEATLDLDDYRRVMATNFWGALHCTLAALPHMRRVGFGRIGNIVSIGGLVAVPHLAPYVASKFALTGLTRALRADLARHGVLVTGVYPKTIRTGGHTHAWFKGDVDAEYLWFASGDTLPLLSASAESVAGKVWDALIHGDPEVMPSITARLAVAAEALLPDWTAELKALIESRMPAPLHPGAPAVQGGEIEGRLAEFLTRMVPDAARPGGSVRASGRNPYSDHH
jgi:NAD(P)-dependent dehydrogenase (short-subunit alcohol dehydrogenase family)